MHPAFINLVTVTATVWVPVLPLVACAFIATGGSDGEGVAADILSIQFKAAAQLHPAGGGVNGKRIIGVIRQRDIIGVGNADCIGNAVAIARRRIGSDDDGFVVAPSSTAKVPRRRPQTPVHVVLLARLTV